MKWKGQDRPTLTHTLATDEYVLITLPSLTLEISIHWWNGIEDIVLTQSSSFALIILVTASLGEYKYTGHVIL